MVPSTIDRILRKAGHKRHDLRGWWGRNDNVGYGVDDNLAPLTVGDREYPSEGYVLVLHDPGPYPANGAVEKALAAYAATLNAAGYPTELVDVRFADDTIPPEPRLLVTPKGRRP